MISELNIILSKGESYTAEFKESADKSIVDEVCAFANASGGRIYVGINDKGEVVGADTSNEARSRLQDTINKIDPRLHVNIEIHDGIIVVAVPEGINKPYSSPNGFFLRSGPNSQKLDRSGIIAFLQAENRVIHDYIIDEKYPISDNFNDAEYQKFLREAKISDVLPREIMLSNLDCAGVAANGALSFTNAGLLFFRNNRNNVRFDFSHVVCVLYKGVDKVYIIDAKHLDGGIMENIDDAVSFLERNLRLRYEIESLQRKNILELPEAALREAVTNAVCHRDNFEKGARVMVEIFDDRVEVTNPGGVPKGITAENFGTTSIARNPVIAGLLHRSHYIERMGTGINRMSDAMEKAGLEKPIFQTEGSFFKVIFRRNQPGADIETAIDSYGEMIGGDRATIVSDKTAIDGYRTAKDSDRTAKDSDRTAKSSDRTAKSSDRTAKSSDRTAKSSDRAAKDSDRKFAIMEHLRCHGQGKSADFAGLLGLSHQRVREILQDLIREGLIEKHGDKRHTYYTAKQD